MVEWSRRCRSSTSPRKRRKNALGQLPAILASWVGRCFVCRDKGWSQVGWSRRLWFVLSRVVKALGQGLSKCHRTVDMAIIWPYLKQRVDGPEDEVLSRIGVIRRPLSWHRARSSVSSKDPVRCGTNDSGYKERDVSIHACCTERDLEG